MTLKEKLFKILGISTKVYDYKEELFYTIVRIVVVSVIFCLWWIVVDFIAR